MSDFTNNGPVGDRATTLSVALMSAVQAGLHKPSSQVEQVKVLILPRRIIPVFKDNQLLLLLLMFLLLSLLIIFHFIYRFVQCRMIKTG